MLTVSESVVTLVKLPEVPVTVIVLVPSAALLLAVNVNVLVFVVAGLGLNAAVTPLGRPDADKLTALLKPFHGVITTSVLPLDPCAKPKVLAAVDNVKFGFPPGQLFTRLAALSVPIPVAKSQPLPAAYAG